MKNLERSTRCCWNECFEASLRVSPTTRCISLAAPCTYLLWSVSSHLLQSSFARRPGPDYWNKLTSFYFDPRSYPDLRFESARLYLGAVGMCELYFSVRVSFSSSAHFFVSQLNSHSQVRRQLFGWWQNLRNYSSKFSQLYLSTAALLKRPATQSVLSFSCPSGSPTWSACGETRSTTVGTRAAAGNGHKKWCSRWRGGEAYFGGSAFWLLPKMPPLYRLS